MAESKGSKERTWEFLAGVKWKWEHEAKGGVQKLLSGLCCLPKECLFTSVVLFVFLLIKQIL